MIAASALFLSFNPGASQAQIKPSANDERTPRFEIGGQLYSLGLSDITDSGIGGRFTYNLNRYLAIDTEVNASLTIEDEGSGINGAQVFGGLKAGRRSGRFGLFAKARPGFVTPFSRATGPTLFNSQRVTKPAFDLGAVLEYYPTGHTVVRFDASDVVIFFGNDLIQEGRCPCPHRLGTKNNLQLSVGFGFRF